MIIVKIMGGLGNQMFQYAIAKSIAVRNKDNFKLDITFYSKQTLRKYELNLLDIDEVLVNKKSFFSKVTSKFRFLTKIYYMERKIAEYDSNVFNKKNVILDGYWQNEKYFKDIRGKILQDFTPVSSLSNKANYYLNSIKNSNSVSVHVRRADYIENINTNANHGVCGLSYYKKAFKYLNNKTDNVTFFIFSDDISWCKKVFRFLERKVFVEDTKSTIDDLELMKNCKHNIIANSTFSWWGAWLNQNEQKIVIAPKKWFVKKEWKNKNPACENWIKI